MAWGQSRYPDIGARRQATQQLIAQNKADAARRRAADNAERNAWWVLGGTVLGAVAGYYTGGAALPLMAKLGMGAALGGGLGGAIAGVTSDAPGSTAMIAGGLTTAAMAGSQLAQAQKVYGGEADYADFLSRMDQTELMAWATAPAGFQTPTAWQQYGAPAAGLYNPTTYASTPPATSGWGYTYADVPPATSGWGVAP
jgi:hypothetical protein